MQSQRKAVKEKSQTPRFSFATAATSADDAIATLSHTSGTAGARAVIARSASPHAAARAVGSVSVLARSIAALTPGSSSWETLALPTGWMLAPLNVGSRN